MLYSTAFRGHTLRMPMDVPPAIEADAPADEMNYALDGVVLTGSSDDLDRAQKAAEASGWGVDRTALFNDQGTLTLRIPAQATMGEFTEYMRRVMDGEFGNVRPGFISRPPSSPSQ